MTVFCGRRKQPGKLKAFVVGNCGWFIEVLIAACKLCHGLIWMRDSDGTALKANKDLKQDTTV